MRLKEVYAWYLPNQERPFALTERIVLRHVVEVAKAGWRVHELYKIAHAMQDSAVLDVAQPLEEGGYALRPVQELLDTQTIRIVLTLVAV